MRMYLSAIAIALSANHLAAAEAIAVVGPGTITCGEYAKSYRQDPGGTDAIIISWVQGFLSGLKVGALVKGEEAKNLGSKSVSQQEQFVHTYCDNHPLSDVWQAAFDLYQSSAADPRH